MERSLFKLTKTEISVEEPKLWKFEVGKSWNFHGNPDFETFRKIHSKTRHRNLKKKRFFPYNFFYFLKYLIEIWYQG